MVANYLDDEDERRERERHIVEEGRALWLKKKQEERDILFKDMDELRELGRLKMFGRPGHGAPTQNVRKKKFTEHQITGLLKRSQSMFSLQDENSQRYQELRQGRRYNDDMALHPRDALNFGRGGHGAPVRTKSGRLRSTLLGNPEIRFQANESVQKSICNAIRYAVDKQEKSDYHQQLEQQIQEKNDLKSKQREDNFSMSKLMEELEGTQWGRPGPGGAYWRSSAITGQGFLDKMGWVTSDDPRKRQSEVKHSEAENIKAQMREVERKRESEHREMMSETGTELAPLLKHAVTGKPRKDPATGYMMNHSLPSTDVTRLATQGQKFLVAASPQYQSQLSGQVMARREEEVREREVAELQQQQHFQSWDSFWGRPGYGAPRDHTHRENLMKNLYFGDNNKIPNSVELVTLERLPVKF